MEAAHRFEEGMVFLDQRFQGGGGAAQSQSSLLLIMAP